MIQVEKLISDKTAEMIAEQVINEITKGKNVNQLLGLQLDTALNMVIPFTEQVEKRVVSKFVAMMEKSIREVYKDGEVKIDELWGTPPVDKAIEF